MKNIYTSVDIGSDTIKVVTCELYHNKLNLLAASSVKSKGIKKGLITDVNAATESVRQALDEIESMLGIKIKRVIVSIPSYFAEYTHVTGSINLPQVEVDDVIDGDDVVKVLQAAVMSHLKQGREMVTVMPLDFMVDDKKVKDPKGISGKTLLTRGIMVTTPNKNIYSVVGLLENMGIEVVDISTSCIGDIHTFKTKQMENQIGAIVNIGSETTTVSIYKKGILVASNILQIGGKNIDNDIAYMYKISLEEAARVKMKFALAHKAHANPNEQIEVETKEHDLIKINQYEVSEIVMSRLEEILTLAKKEINILNSQTVNYVIITGGTTNILHFRYIVDEIFHGKATLGNIKLVGIRNNKYSSAVGNIVYFIGKLKLKDKNYSMVSNRDAMDLSSSKKNSINISNDTMLGKIFGYFFSE